MKKELSKKFNGIELVVRETENGMYFDISGVAHKFNKKMSEYSNRKSFKEYAEALGKNPHDLILVEIHNKIEIHEGIIDDFLEWAQRPIRGRENDGVYIISDGEFTKIGVALNVAKRLKGLQTANARKLELLFYSKVDDSCSMELKLHKYFKSNRLQGEWFDLTTKEITNAIALIQKGL